jgi:hypothetical protein
MFCFSITSMIKTEEYILCEKSLILKNCYKIVIEWACNASNYSRWWCRQHDPQTTGVISWVGNSKLHMRRVWVLSLPETALLELFISRRALLKDMGTNIKILFLVMIVVANRWPRLIWETTESISETFYPQLIDISRMNTLF